MGQIVFVPNAGSGGSGSSDSSFLANLFDSAEEQVDYLASDTQVFRPETSFSVIVAFRFVQQPGIEEGIHIISCADGDGVVWGIHISSSTLVAQMGGAEVTPTSTDIPLGRVIVAILAYDSAEEETTFYLNGRYMGSVSGAIPAPLGDAFLQIGPDETWEKNYGEYIGFAFINALLTPVQAADVCVLTQDTGVVAFPSDVVGTRAIYNAATGLSDLAVWTPEENTMSAPDLVATPVGERLLTGEILAAPYYPAHSGWAIPPGGIKMPSEADKKELVQKVTQYVSATYGGTGADAWARAFSAVDADHDGQINKPELYELLSRAGVGNAFTRSAWTDGVMTYLDFDRTSGISLNELLAALTQPVPQPSPQPQPLRPPPQPILPPFYYPPPPPLPTPPVPVSRPVPLPPPSPPTPPTAFPWGWLAAIGSALALVQYARRLRRQRSVRHGA